MCLGPNAPPCLPAATLKCPSFSQHNIERFNNTNRAVDTEKLLIIVLVTRAALTSFTGTSGFSRLHPIMLISSSVEV